MENDRKMGKSAFYFWVTFAALVDLANIKIPFIGIFFVIIATITFWIKGYAGGASSLMIKAGIAEAFPFINKALPGCVYFVIRRYAANKHATKDVLGEDSA